MQRARKDWLILALICAIYIAFTSYQLWDLPGAWYNDITTEHKEVTAILAGGWPWRFNLSAGPAYHYIVASFAYFLKPTYVTYKIASLVTGLAVLPLLYLLGRELFGRRVGLLAALVGALSFWLILFARLGSSPQILSPVLSVAAVYFVARFARTWHYLDIALSMALAAMGLFTYPSTFVLPLVVLTIIGWQLVFAPEQPHAWMRAKQLGLKEPVASAWKMRLRWALALILSIVVLVPFTVWFVSVANSSADFSQSGYVGSKLTGSGGLLDGANESPASLVMVLIGLIGTFARNMLHALGMFQFTGDVAFRTNVSGKPVLDLLSGLLLDLGLIWLLVDPRLRRRWGYLLIPIVILVAPSAIPGTPAVEIPSASRALGAAPFVFMLVGLGLEAAWNFFARWVTERTAQRAARPAARPVGVPALQSIPVTGRPRRWDQRLAGWLVPYPQPSRSGLVLSSLLVGLLVAGAAYFNINRYFVDYAAGLPEENQPWGTQIAQWVDSLPTSTEVRLTACCWGEWKQPEPDDIYYMLKHPQGRETLRANRITRCQDVLPGKPYALIFRPDDEDGLMTAFQACFPRAEGEMHYDGLGEPAFYTMLIR